MKIFSKGSTMKTPLIFLLAAGLLCGAALIGCDLEQSEKSDFMIETFAMSIGYHLRNDFEWTESAESYYIAIMEGKMSLDAAQAAEAYLRTVTHPLIANRLVKLAGMVGFDMDAGKLVGVDKVDMHLLKIAAQGFRQGLLLE